MRKTVVTSIEKLTKSILVSFLAFTLIACQNESSAEPLDESKYSVLPKPLTVSTGDKIEVLELFWYGCGHCFAIETPVENWLKNKPENAEFVKVPAVFSKRWEFHAKAFYTMESLGVLKQANKGFFHHIHVGKKPMGNIDQLVAFLADYEKTEEEVKSAFNSFAVDNNLRNAVKITRQSTARGVPAFIIDGKYLTSVGDAGGTVQLFDTIDQLVEKAASER